MLPRITCLLVVVSLQMRPAEPEPQDIVRRSLRNDTMNFERSREYAFQRHEVVRRLDRKGNAQKVETSTFDVVGIGGELYSKLVARDGRPLNEKDAKAAQQKMDAAIRKRQQESPQARARRLEERRKQELEGRRFMLEIPEAFSFRLVAEEVLDGRDVWVLDAEPRPDYKPKVKRAEILKKFKGRLWIDKREYQWVRVEGETIDTVSFGLVLARLGKGAKIVFEQRPVNGEVWLPHLATARIDARVAVLKEFRVDSEVRWSGYRRFQTDSRVVSAEEIVPAASK